MFTFFKNLFGLFFAKDKPPQAQSVFDMKHVRTPGLDSELHTIVQSFGYMGQFDLEAIGLHLFEKGLMANLYPNDSGEGFHWSIEPIPSFCETPQA
jgi:hypothetical protein